MTLASVASIDCYIQLDSDAQSAINDKDNLNLYGRHFYIFHADTLKSSFIYMYNLLCA